MTKLSSKIKITPDTWAGIQMQLGDELLTHAILNKKMNKWHDRNDIIYHYTSLHSFISIIESQSLYCTNLNFLNDKKEYKFGIEQIKSVLEKFKQEGFSQNIVEKFEKHIDKIVNSERFVTCFSKSGDMLSQWRAYANQGKGISIGFDSSKLSRSLYQSVKATHVEYDEKYQLQVIEELIRVSIAFFEERKDLIEWEDYGYEWMITTAVIGFLGEIISSYKSASFKEEKEYRFEYSVPNNEFYGEEEPIHFRTSETAIIPFIILETEHKRYERTWIDKDYPKPQTVIDKLPIKEIIVGPSLDFELIKLGINQLLKKYNYEGVEIKCSNIPYRL
ncbi:DUF2971 domain-containing protein [Sphingobacterium wenxiniae]|uniref:DUF2971 domain-containing protein n=1 Tax=Sphingobacterium wenxiniae TaxID=683125 RepID=A0A1I6TGY9_9SPHI|nr:DUF2971 domain-containing protein [Sphingobacterium wenxiniae]SFS88453.1 Protein of unknown function [Sphingobacterium wenxiniae]